MTAPRPTTPELVDADARRRALTVFDTNLVFTAGAGTGKTALLVGRLAAALVKRHVEPRAVLALTFTENAAAEMHERLLRLLSSAEAFVEGGEIAAGSDRHTLEALNIGREELPRIRDLLERSEELQIQTFHGFCLRLMQQHARALGLPPRLDLIDEDERARALDRAFVAWMREQDAEPHDALIRFEPGALRTLAGALASGMPPEALVDPASRRYTPDDALLDDIERDVAQLRADAEGGRRQFFERLDEILAACRRLRAGDPIEHLGAAATGGKKELGKERSEELKKRIGEVIDRLQPWREGDDEAVSTALDFLAPFLDRWRTEIRRTGTWAFDDLITWTRHVLRTDARLRAQIGGSYQTILVDEFQDTDPLQYDIVFLLGADHEALGGDIPDDPLAVPLRPCLFLVGDAKQSIYRFRRADLAAFDRVQKLVLAQGGEPLELTTNFRSTPAVLDFVNAVCHELIVEDPPFQAEFAPVDAHVDDEEPRAPVEFWIPAEDDGADDGAETGPLPGLSATESETRRAREGELVVRWIRETEAAGIPFGRQAILLRSVRDLGWLLRPLRRTGIPYVLQGSRRFYSRHEVQLATALLLAVARPWDPAPVVGVLRSAFVGARDAEIFDWLSQDDERRRSLDLRRAPRDATAQDRVGAGLCWLADLHHRAVRLPVQDAIDLVLGLEEWPLVEGMGFEGAQCLANLDRLRAELARLAPDDLAQAASLLERRVLREFDDEEGSLFETGDEDIKAVRILSAHASKGLEFDAVMIPDCATPPRGSNELGSGQVSRLFLPDGRVLLAAMVGDVCNAAAIRVNVESKAHRLAEEARLLYVAATRARRRLTFLFAPSDPNGARSWQKALQEAGVGERDGPWHVREVEHRAIERDRTDPAHAAQAGEAATADLVRAATAWNDRVTARGHAGARPPEPIPPRTRPGSAATLGSELHEYLRLVELRASSPRADLLRQCAQEIGGRAPGRELRELAQNFHDSTLRERLVAARAVHREVPVSWTATDGTPCHGILDALVEDAPGDWSILDYKTDDLSAEELADDALARTAARRHGSQLRAYVEGVRAALELTSSPRAFVWFARHDRLVEVDELEAAP